MGEALAGMGDALPTYRAHNEQGMAHAAIAFAKASRRERAMACTTSIGPGATNMVTAAALAHVNRLPVLFLPGDVYASRRPDPVLAADRGFRRRDGQRQRLLPAGRRAISTGSPGPSNCSTPCPRAMAVLTDPAQLRAGDAGAVPGRAGRGVRLSRELLRRARLAAAAGAAGCARTGRRWPLRSGRRRRR